MKSSKTWSRKKMVGVAAVALGAIATFGAATLAGSSGAGSSGGPGGARAITHRERVFAAFERIQRELKLTAEQRSQIRTILRDALPKGRAIHENKNLTPEQKKAALQELRAATRARIQPILTPEQQQKLAALWAGRRDRAHEILQRIATELE
ncbi:MAG: hypothetical protein M3347_18520, partial [Armatimonadota bacterium]|nr:hypothetical protein [Armatimonadota bacterium]